MSTVRNALLILVCLIPMVSVQAEDTDDAILQVFCDRYGLSGPEYRVEVMSNRLKAPEFTAEEVSFNPLTKKEPLGLYTVQVEINRAGERIDRAQVRFRITRFAEALVAVDKIKRHQELSPDQFEVVLSDVTNLSERPLSKVEEVAGQRSTRNLRPGTILTSGSVEAIPDVALGGDILISYTGDWGSITAPGRAMEAGWVGSTMRVKNLATGKVVKGKVTSAGSIEVNP